VTGRELIDWIVEHGAEEMEVLWVDDEQMVYRAIPEVMNNSELRKKYANTGRLKADGRSVVV
jgi:hypothetical protein